MIDDRVVSSKRKKHLLKVQFIGRNPGHTHVGAEPANSNFYRKEIHHTSVLRGKVEDPEEVQLILREQDSQMNRKNEKGLDLSFF